jgi:hypothetical protein
MKRKENLNSDVNNSTNIISRLKSFNTKEDLTMTYADGNPGPVLRQVQKSDGDKLVNVIPTLTLDNWILMAIQK